MNLQITWYSNLSFQILHINKPATQLDTILHFALSNAEVDKVNAKREAELSDKMVQSLDSRMKAMKVQRDRDLMEKERHIAHLDHVISEKEAQIRAAERKMKDMTQKWQESTEELKKWKTRTELLEKTRRLGYYTPGNIPEVFFPIQYFQCYTLSSIAPNKLCKLGE